MISILAPSRGRPEKSASTLSKWIFNASVKEDLEIIVSVDEDDDRLTDYQIDHFEKEPLKGKQKILVSKNRSAVDAINNAAKVSEGNILMVVSDDTDCFAFWDQKLRSEIAGKTEFIIKTKDGIQDWIITNPILDRAYYNRNGYIYDPDFKHMFCDTWLTVQADISGRKITSNLLFKHNHYSNSGGKEQPDELNKRNDATWSEGEKVFIQKLKQTPVEDLRKITDQGMKNWIRSHAGIRL